MHDSSNPPMQMAIDVTVWLSSLNPVYSTAELWCHFHVSMRFYSDSLNFVRQNVKLPKHTTFPSLIQRHWRVISKSTIDVQCWDKIQCKKLQLLLVQSSPIFKRLQQRHVCLICSVLEDIWAQEYQMITSYLRENQALKEKLALYGGCGRGQSC